MKYTDIPRVVVTIFSRRIKFISGWLLPLAFIFSMESIILELKIGLVWFLDPFFLIESKPIYFDILSLIFSGMSQILFFLNFSMTVYMKSQISFSKVKLPIAIWFFIISSFIITFFLIFLFFLVFIALLSFDKSTAHNSLTCLDFSYCIFGYLAVCVLILWNFCAVVLGKKKEIIRLCNTSYMFVLLFFGILLLIISAYYCFNLLIDQQVKIMGTVSFMFILILTVVNLFHLSNKFLINYFKYDILTFFILGLLGTLVLKIIIFVVFILIKKELLYGTFYSILTYFHYGLILESVFATFCGTYVWFADFFNLKKSSNILSLIHFYTLLIG